MFTKQINVLKLFIPLPIQNNSWQWMLDVNTLKIFKNVYAALFSFLFFFRFLSVIKLFSVLTDDAAARANPPPPSKNAEWPSQTFRLLSSFCSLLSNQLGPWTHSHAQWTQTTWPIEHPTDCVISACWIKNKHRGLLAVLRRPGLSERPSHPPPLFI